MLHHRPTPLVGAYHRGQLAFQRGLQHDGAEALPHPRCKLIVTLKLLDKLAVRGELEAEFGQR